MTNDIQQKKKYNPIISINESMSRKLCLVTEKKYSVFFFNLIPLLILFFKFK